MSELAKSNPTNRPVSRRALLQGAAALCASSIAPAWSEKIAQAGPVNPAAFALRRAAEQSGKLLGMYTVEHEVILEPLPSEMIAKTFGLIADGNDLKFSNRLRPTPDTFNFTNGDQVIGWAEQHGLLFRGHCLVWWNALPTWFTSYVTRENAKQVMTNHITTVVKHYAGRVYSWDVVNEAVHFDSGPDGLREKPWISLIGPEYIDLAFHTAEAADPRARRLLNECYIEHDTPSEKNRRAALLALATKLKRNGVPVTGIGVQGHLRGNTPLDTAGMQDFCKRIQDLGLQIQITELDVDDVDVSGDRIDQTVAGKYAEFLDLMGPYAEVITFEQLRDDPNLPKRADGRAHRPNLFDADYQPTPAFASALRAVEQMPHGPKRRKDKA